MADAGVGTTSQAVGRGPLADEQQAVVGGRAMTGPAHGEAWTMPGAPEVSVVLTVGSRPAVYRLLFHPRTRRPVRDHAGSFVYVPLTTGPIL